MALFSSRGPAFAAVERWKAQGLTTVEAIDRIAGGDRPTVPETRVSNGDGASAGGPATRHTDIEGGRA